MATLKPSRYLQKLAAKIFESTDVQAQFIAALLEPERYPEAILWLSNGSDRSLFQTVDRLVWQPEFVDRLVPGQRPGAHALHQAGAYYCLDFSSVFAATILSAIEIEAPVVLDLCAAPGGKSVYSFRSLKPEILLCNEVIGKRLGALTSNLKRCSIEPVIVTNRDPAFLAENFTAGADVVVVDAPCSGQSLLTKGQESGGCFHPATVNLNKNRQRRIIAESGKIIAPGGYLAYMTCTFSPEENEELVKWFLKRFPQFSPCEIPKLDSFRSHLSDSPCYRLWPQQGIGAGSFAALFKNNEHGIRADYDLSELPISWSNPESLREESKGYQRKHR